MGKPPDAAAVAGTGGSAGTLRLWVKIDTGLGRAGVRWDDLARLEAVGAALQQAAGLEYAGVLTHAGHSYSARSREALVGIHAESVSRLGAARDLLEPRIGRAGTGIPGLGPAGIEHAETAHAESGHAGELSIGDTPTCSTVERFDGVDEIRPGNFVFYDLMQLAIGSCRREDIAVAIACPVVGKYARRGEIVIYGGAVHVSKEALAGWTASGAGSGVDAGGDTGADAGGDTGADAGGYVGGDADHAPATIYGCLAIDPGAGLGRPEPRAPVVALSQEHGVVRVPPDLWDAVDVGDLVLVYPVHACLACDLHPQYVTLEGRRIERLTQAGGTPR